jgi:hypothetical protein
MDVGAGLVVIATGLVATLAVLIGTQWNPGGQTRFDAAEWRVTAPRACDDDHRERMVKDLDDEYLMVGMTPARVRQLLGPPQYESRWWGGKWTWAYDTGRNGSDCDELYVEFGRDGRRVTKWEHRILND